MAPKTGTSVRPKPKPPKVPAVAPNGREALLPLLAERRYTGFFIARKTFGGMGGPWTEEIIAIEEANKKLGGMMAEGWEPVFITSLAVTTQGILILWVLGRLPEGEKPRWTRIDHYVRGIGSGPNPVSPLLSRMAYEQAMTEKAEKGWTLFTMKDLGFDASAFNLMSVWVS